MVCIMFSLVDILYKVLYGKYILLDFIREIKCKKTPNYWSSLGFSHALHITTVYSEMSEYRQTSNILFGNTK